MVSRRKALITIGSAASTIAIAGCSSSSDDDTSASGDDEVESGDGNEEEEEEEEEETVTTHEVGDTFTVGEGDQVIEYTVNSATIASCPLSR